MGFSTILFCWIALLQPAPVSWDERALAAIERFDAALQKVQGLAYSFVKYERLRGGEIVDMEISVKVRANGDVYMRQVRPKSGPELCYRPTREPKKMTVHPGHFPDITLDISIWGSLATEDQHHLVTHAGQRYILEQVERGIRDSVREPAGERMEYEGPIDFQGRKAERVVLHAGTKKMRSVRAKDDESVYAFAARHGCDPYLVVYYNESVDGLSDELDSDRDYWIPSYYGKQVELILDVETALLLKVTVTDFSGRLYERYEYRDLMVNPALGDLDFDPDNPAYDF